MFRLNSVALVLLTGLVQLVAFAQSQAANITISGTVEDPARAVVPQAKVELRSLDGKRIASASSDEEGAFHVPAFKRGEYIIEVRRQGFKPFITHVVLSNASRKPIVAKLEIADLAQQTEVTAGSDTSPVSTDPAENRDAAVVNQNALEHLPIFDQDYVSTLSNFLDQGSVGTMGTTIVVDGLEQKDAGVTASAIANIKINSDPYSAEFSRPGRGRMEITTKSPDPTYHGTLNFIFRDYHLDARNAFAAVRSPEQKRTFEGVLTGPLGTFKKTFFLLSGDYQKDNIQSFIFAQLPSGLLQANLPSPIGAKDLAARVTHDINDKQTVILQFTYEGQSRQNQLSSGQNLTAGSGPGGGRNSSGQTQASGGYVLPEAGRNLSSLERHITLTDKLVMTPNLLNQFQVMFERNRDSTASTSEQPQVIVLNSFVGGGAQATQLATENNVDFRDVLTWSHKSHTVSTGLAVPNMSRRGLDDYSNRLGTFSFASLQDFTSGLPFSFTRQQGPTHFVYWQKEVGGFVQDQVRLSANLQVTLGVRWDWQNYLHDDNNFAPRASIAYAFGRKRDSVVRAGGGIFYDRTSARPLGNLTLYSAPSLYSILLLNPTYPNPAINGAAFRAQPANLYRLSPTIRTPYLGMYSVAIEHKLLSGATVAVTYRGMTGVSLFEALNVNQPLPPFYVVRPNPRYGVYHEIQSSGRQISQALDLSFSGKVNKILSGLAQYSLSSTKNNTGGITYMPPNTYDLSGEYGRSDTDQRHRFNMLASSSPYKWLDLGLGLTAASGLPYTLTLGEDLYNSGFATARPEGVRRNSLQGPGYLELDVRWSHEFFLSGKGDKGPLAMLAVDAFNLPNHVNFSQYVGNLQSPFFGRAVSALPARRLQLTLRFTL